MNTMTVSGWVAKVAVFVSLAGCAGHAHDSDSAPALAISVEYHFDGLWRGAGRPGTSNPDGWIQPALRLFCDGGEEGFAFESEPLPRGTADITFEWRLPEVCESPFAYFDHTWWVTTGKEPFLAPFTERSSELPVSHLRLHVVGLDWYDKETEDGTVGFLKEHFVWELYGPSSQ